MGSPNGMQLEYWDKPEIQSSIQLKLAWPFHPTLFKFRCKALTIRGPLKPLLPSCSRKTVEIKLLASGTVKTEVDYRRDKWDFVERNPPDFQPWVKHINQMGAGPKQLLLAQYRYCPSMKVEFSVVLETR
jgi:hypothetical protein